LQKVLQAPKKVLRESLICTQKKLAELMSLFLAREALQPMSEPKARSKFSCFGIFSKNC
jgi:hypothetical protein